MSRRRILVAHGTRRADGVAMVEEIAAAVAARVGPIDIAYVDVLGPTPSEALRRSDAPTVLVPCFLAAGYHVHVDLPEHVVSSGHPDVVVTAPIGPDPMLAAGLHRRLTEVGYRQGDEVVLGSTGSSDPRARADVARMADLLAERIGVPVPVGFLAAGSPTVEDLLTPVPGAQRRVFIAAYQLADGLFHERLREIGARTPGVGGVSRPLGSAPEVVDLIAARFASAQAQSR